MFLPLEISRDGESVAGGKAWRLSLIRRELGLPVPDGFVVTASACRFFVEANRPQTNHRCRTCRDRSFRCRQIGVDCIASGSNHLPVPVPAPLAREIWEAANQLAPGMKHLRFAVRSSAVGEDGSLSFAGQHQSVLNVDLDGIVAEHTNRSSPASTRLVRSPTGSATV